MLTTQPPALDELGLRRRADPHGAGEVDREDVGKDVRVVLGVAPDHAGRVDEDVEAREAGEQFRHGLGAADVGGGERDPRFSASVAA